MPRIRNDPMNNYLICIPAYKRAKSLQRLLNTLKNAYYESEKIPLIISLEFGSSKSVISIAEDFNHKQFQKIIIYRKKKFGLKKHIIECGSLVNDFGNIILLEDDLIVDRYFYKYSYECSKFYENDNSIAGISLYAQEFNEMNGFPFKPLKNGYSTFKLQFPSSSGQCWSKKQFNSFLKWYQNKDDEYINKIPNFPDFIKRWRNSWKKFYAAYLFETNKFFIYPYQSYSSNCCDDGGVHTSRSINIHQTNFAYQSRGVDNFDFSPIDEEVIKYDLYYEQCGDLVFNYLGIKNKDIHVDIYGSKPLNMLRERKYSLTIKSSKNILKKFPLIFKPIENNLISYENIEENSNININLALSNNIYGGIKSYKYGKLLYELISTDLFEPKKLKIFCFFVIIEIIKSIIIKLKKMFNIKN